MLEELSHALKRGANIICEIVACVEACDGHNIMMMDPEAKQIKRILRQVMSESNITNDKIDYINAHGTGTLQNDETESAVIADLFGKVPLVNSTESLIGHTLGASGAIAAVVTALSILHKKTHVCKNLQNPIRDLNFVQTVKETDICTAILQSFAFGGHNASLLFKTYK